MTSMATCCTCGAGNTAAVFSGPSRLTSARSSPQQDREFEGSAVVGELLLQAGFAMEAVEGDPFANDRVVDAVVVTYCFVPDEPVK